MKIGEAISIRIIDLCQSYDITVNKLATHCGLSPSTIKNIIYGNSKSPNVSTIKSICDGLSINMHDFFDCEIFYDLDQEIE